MKLFVIGDRETVLGFRLVGIDGIVASEYGPTLAALQSAREQKEVGVVLITEKLAASVREEVDARLYGLGWPLVLEIPDASGPMPGRPNVEEVVRRAIGISL